MLEDFEEIFFITSYFKSDLQQNIFYLVCVFFNAKVRKITLFMNINIHVIQTDGLGSHPKLMVFWMVCLKIYSK